MRFEVVRRFGDSGKLHNMLDEREKTKPATDSQASRLPVVPNQDPQQDPKQVPEIGGPPGPEPTRYGDWERAGRCIDF